MNISEYFKYAVSEDLLKNLDWYYAMLTLPAKDNSENEYVKFINKKYIVKLKDREEPLTGVDNSRPPLTIKDVVTLTKEDLPNIDKPVETKIGIAIANYLLLVLPFKDKLPYINGEVKISDIEKTVQENLTNDVVKPSDISVKEYVRFADNAMFVTNLARIIVVSATYKAILPPPGIDEYKKKLIKEFKEKHGEDVFKDYVKVAELEELLKKYDDEWLKDDPSYGMLLSGKVKNVSRAKLFLMYGAETAFDKSGDATTVLTSLDDGWPDDPKELANLYNASRAGSYDRGKDTQNGGVAAKVILRATNSIKIVDGDCGSKLGYTTGINKDNQTYMLGRHVIIGSKTIEITKDNINSYLGKEVTLRSPAYCATKDNNICEVCAGSKLADYKDAVSLVLLKLSSILLGISMSSMHSRALVTLEYDLNDGIS